MRKKFCNFLGVVLAVSLMIPGGALNAFADESTSGNNASQAATEQALNGSEAKDQETQEEQTKTVPEDKQSSSSEQQVSEDGANQDINGTRAGPLSGAATGTMAEQDFSSNLITPVMLTSAVAAPKAADVNITNFEIQTVDHKKADTLFHSDTFLLKMDWSATGHGTDLHEGDYFDIDLPNNMKFPSGTTARDFDITDDSGNVIAHAHVTPGPNDTGGKVHVTFGKGVENKYNVKGTINLAARFDETKIKKDQENKFEVTVNGNVPGQSHTASTGVNITGSKPIEEEYLTKWGQRSGDSDKNKAEWWSRINFSKATLTNAVVTDSLGSSGMTYIKESFILRKVVYDKMGDTTSVLEEYKANDLINSGKLKFSADMTSFTLNLGNTSDQYRLIYRSTYVPGTILKNKMKLNSDQKQKEVIAAHQSAESGGSASGDLASKIKIVKVDEDGTTPLKDAVFTVTKPDGSTFELTTGADGTVASGVLVQGTYKVKEKTAPKGYELGTDEYTLQVTPTGGAIQKVTNKPTKISLPVKKSWIGPKVGPVTVHLLADGTDTGKTVTLDEASGWKGQFDNLRKCKPDGTEIVYTVKEDDVPNYTGAITGDATTGFTITNTNTEKVNVPVKKEWVGPKAGPVTVHLLADGTDTGKTVTLNEANSWADTFSGLDKYKADGTEIVYTVKEDDVPNYTGAITGDATTGFTITNTNTEKVNVPVKKEWVGPKAGPVTVHLLADGTDTGKTVTLNEANSWADTFSGLDKYKADGTEIVYTVKEDDVAGYTSEVTGDANTGFTVTNTQIPPHETPKPKKPSKKVQKVPYTGDASVLSTVIPLTAGAIVLLGAGIFLGKKDK